MLYITACRAVPEFVDRPADVVFTEFLTEELKSSSAYNEAIKHNAVIKFNREILTSGVAPREFVENVRKGRSDRLYLYGFERLMGYESEPPYYSAFCTIYDYNAADKTFIIRYEKTDSENPWNSPWEDQKGRYPVREKPVLNEYGYFLVSEYKGFQVVSDYELYEGFNELKAAKERFIDPIWWNVLLGVTFDSFNDIEHLLFLFDDLYSFIKREGILDQYGSDIPMPLITELVTSYFDCGEEDIKAKLEEYYNKEADTCVFKGKPPIAADINLDERVLEYNQSGDTATIVYTQYDTHSGEPKDIRYTMTVRLLEDGSFRYISIIAQK